VQRRYGSARSASLVKTRDTYESCIKGHCRGRAIRRDPTGATSEAHNTQLDAPRIGHLSRGTRHRTGLSEPGAWHA